MTPKEIKNARTEWPLDHRDFCQSCMADEPCDWWDVIVTLNLALDHIES